MDVLIDLFFNVATLCTCLYALYAMFYKIPKLEQALRIAHKKAELFSIIDKLEKQ